MACQRTQHRPVSQSCAISHQHVQLSDSLNLCRFVRFSLWPFLFSTAPRQNSFTNRFSKNTVFIRKVIVNSVIVKSVIDSF